MSDFGSGFSREFGDYQGSFNGFGTASDNFGPTSGGSVSGPGFNGASNGGGFNGESLFSNGGGFNAGELGGSVDGGSFDGANGVFHGASLGDMHFGTLSGGMDGISGLSGYLDQFLMLCNQLFGSFGGMGLF